MRGWWDSCAGQRGEWKESADPPRGQRGPDLALGNHHTFWKNNAKCLQINNKNTLFWMSSWRRHWLCAVTLVIWFHFAKPVQLQCTMELFTSKLLCLACLLCSITRAGNKCLKADGNYVLLGELTLSCTKLFLSMIILSEKWLQNTDSTDSSPLCPEVVVVISPSEGLNSCSQNNHGTSYWLTFIQFFSVLFNSRQGPDCC